MTGGSDPRTERLRDPRGVHSEAWKRTLAEMETIATERRADGWETLTVMAAHTDTVSKDMNDHDEFGLFHVVPDGQGAAFAETFDEEMFTEYLVYGTEIEAYMYAVTEFLDPEGERSILLASRYDMSRAAGMVASAEEAGVLYSHVRTVDGTTLGTFVHEEYEPLITKPNA